MHPASRFDVPLFLESGVMNALAARPGRPGHGALAAISGRAFDATTSALDRSIDMRIKALTFDTGGTVLDWHGGLVQALSRAGPRTASGSTGTRSPITGAARR